MIEFNYDDEIVSSPAVIVSGKTSTFDHGVIQFVNNENKVFPTLNFEVNNYYFKALVHVSPNENNFKVMFWGGARLDDTGEPIKKGEVTEEGKFKLHFNPLPENKPVHLCVIIAKDSKGVYDMPKYKLKRGEKANLDTAIQRLKVAGRMMQAFTQDHFHNYQLGNRSFQFVEESTKSQKLFGIDKKASVAHTEVKVHVIRSPKTMAEIRDPDWAQQNPNAEEEGGLFRHALEIIYNHDLIKPYKKANTAIQCAVMFLDSTWDGKLITGHTGMGGGSDEIRLAVFGSHGLHSYPLNFPQMSPCFTDDTELSINEVANDVNQSGTAWECLNISMGSFMHEIGFMFGTIQQVDGIMSRDFVWWNRSFMTRETRCLREESPGRIIETNGKFPRECRWNILDITRFLYHGSFSIPSDLTEANFEKLNSTLMKPSEKKQLPYIQVEKQGQVTIKSSSGIYLVEIVNHYLTRSHMRFIPKLHGGSGAPLEVSINFEETLGSLKKGWGSSINDFGLRILSTAGEIWEPDFRFRSHPTPDSIIQDDFNLGKGIIKANKSMMLGKKNGPMAYIGIDLTRVFKIRVYHGNALDGMTFYSHVKKHGKMKRFARRFLKRQWFSSLFNDSSIEEEDDESTENEDAVSDEEQTSLTENGEDINDEFTEDEEIENHDVSESQYGELENTKDLFNSDIEEVSLGKVRSSYTEFLLSEGESFITFSFRTGEWIDAMEFGTDWGRSTGLLGNKTGGGLTLLEPPTGHTVVGLYGYTGPEWLFGIGIIYAKL